MSKTNDTTTEPTVTDSTDETTEATKFVVASQVKTLIRNRGYCVSGDLIEALSSRVKQILEQGIARAESNSRKTIRPCDI